jgi:hypothetical protein
MRREGSAKHSRARSGSCALAAHNYAFKRTAGTGHGVSWRSFGPLPLNAALYATGLIRCGFSEAISADPARLCCQRINVKSIARTVEKIYSAQRFESKAFGLPAAFSPQRSGGSLHRVIPLGSDREGPEAGRVR